MSTILTGFLIELSENPAKLREFRHAPDRVARAAGLSPLERSAVASRSSRQIRGLLSGDSPVVPPPVFVQSTVVDLAASA
ncbi:MAG: hypothetical protein KDD11_11445 [Acidobacteria bacterium]|nr:hypothetical protein [Acidobacteriota bacterium]